LLAIALLNSVATIKAADVGMLFDFKGDLYTAGQAILHGRSPYQPGLLSHQAAILRAGGTLGWIASPRYPPLVLVLAAPLSLLPFKVAGFAFLGVSVAAVAGAMRALGVRDWRCIAVACASAPAVFGVWLGNLSSIILLGAALAWHWRSRVPAAAGTVAGVIAAKLFVWPLGVWLLITRRFRSFVLTVAMGIVGTGLAWAAIGFAGLSSYPSMLANVAYIGETRGRSLMAAFLSAGLSPGPARALSVAFTAVLLGAAWRLLGRVPDGDRRAYGLTIVACLTATPVVWLHYLVLLYVPIALLSPSFSPVWFLPTLAGFATGIDLMIELAVICWLCSPLLVRRRGGVRHGAPKTALTSVISATPD
jgi:hypothetical protein